MDAKSLAKSKRAHSQQHQSKKPHPNQKAKASVITSPTDGTQKKPSGKPNSRQIRGSSSKLPSNWDRYEDEFESGSEDPSVGNPSQPTDIVMPKSKGADFAYLISEAQSQSSSTLDNFSSFHDSLPDYDKAMSSMLSVRGKSILSWIGDDSFILDGNNTTDYEAPFLSMDLNALASQLEKLDVSQRLFIEADLLPTELPAGGSDETISQDSVEAEADRSADHMPKVVYSTATRSNLSFQKDPYQGVDEVDELLKSVNDESNRLGNTDLSGILDCMEQLKVNSVPISEPKNSKFEASAAEAELDMLLNSFSDGTHLDSSTMNQKHTFPFPVSDRVGSTSYMDRSITSNTTTIDLEDTLDELLGETRTPTNQKDSKPSSVETKPVTSDFPSLAPSSAHSGSKVLDEFDSWLDTI